MSQYDVLSGYFKIFSRFMSLISFGEIEFIFSIVNLYIEKKAKICMI